MLNWLSLTMVALRGISHVGHNDVSSTEWPPVYIVYIYAKWCLLSFAVHRRDCTGHQWPLWLSSVNVTTLHHRADCDAAMDRTNIIANSEKEFAVIKFQADDTYCTCSQRNKSTDSARFLVGEEVTIQWSKHEVYRGIVVFTNGKKFNEIWFVALSMSLDTGYLCAFCHFSLKHTIFIVSRWSVYLRLCYRKLGRCLTTKRNQRLCFFIITY